MKHKKKISFMLAMLLSFSPIINYKTYATKATIEKESPIKEITNIKTQKEFEKITKKIDTMNDEELKKLGSYIKNYFEKESRDYMDKQIKRFALKAAWYVAAKQARNLGYDLSATLIEYSVLNKNYEETDGKFADAIKKTSTYKYLINNDVPRADSYNFSRSEYPDLFFSLHSFDYLKSPNFMYITDTYDFKFSQSYDGFVNKINDWAFLCQNMDVLEVIFVSIGINR